MYASSMEHHMYASQTGSPKCYVPPNEVLFKVLHQGETKLFRQPVANISFEQLTMDVKRRFDTQNEIKFAAFDPLSKTYSLIGSLLSMKSFVSGRSVVNLILVECKSEEALQVEPRQGITQVQHLYMFLSRLAQLRRASEIKMVLHDFITKNQSEKQLTQQETLTKLEWCLDKCDEIYKQAQDLSRGSNQLRDSIGSRHSSLNSANNSVNNPFVPADQTNQSLRLSQISTLRAQLKPEEPQPNPVPTKTDLKQPV